MLHFLASPAARPISEDEYLLQAPHVCEMDNIRIPVANLVDTCLVYVFPSKAFGFDVVFPNKVLSEHKILATDLDDLESLGPEKWTSEACRVATNIAVLARIETVTVSNHDQNYQLEQLTKWFYEGTEDNEALRLEKIRC